MGTFEAVLDNPAERDSLIASRIQNLKVGHLAVQPYLQIEDTIPPYTADELREGHPMIMPEFTEVLSRTTSFDVTPDKTIERRRSAHGVSFGRLIGPKRNKQGREGSLLSVAYKMFDRPDKAVQEVEGYHILRELGMDTFEPVAIVPTPDSANFVVITKKRDDLMSLDRDDWIVGRQPRDARELEIAERNTTTVKEIATVLAFIHSKGIFHPDGQVKNFATNEQGRVGIIDTENLISRDITDPDNPGMAWRDIQKLVRSLLVENKYNGESDEDTDKIFGVGMLANMGQLFTRNACAELIIDPYIGALEDAIRDGGDADYLTSLAYTIQESFEHDKEWPLNLV
jgi:hypothetical protein